MQDVKKIAEGLHHLEKAVVPFLKDNVSVSDLIAKTGLKDIEVMRALHWLGNKGLISVDNIESEFVDLGANGKDFLKNKLPERRLIDAIKNHELSVDDVSNTAGLGREEVNAVIGVLRKDGLIDIKKDKDLMLSLTNKGREFVNKDLPQEVFLKKNFPVALSDLSSSDKILLSDLKKRRDFVVVGFRKETSVKINSLCKDIQKIDLSKFDLIDKITSNVILSGEWKNKSFRRFDVLADVPKVYGGKRHFVKQAMLYAKKVWLEMGFKEMQGPLLQTSFWNFDALFTAQDHPVRDMQDTFFIKDPGNGSLPDKSLVKKVQLSHESGWGYKWNSAEAGKNVLRTHTTVLSAHVLAELKKTELPAKFFSVGRCFRNEAVDWSHLAEFNQTEGIVVDPNANFRHLFGYLKEFFSKMGFPKARFRPAHFPYTEPSVEIDVFHPVHKKWVELGGAGIFRPEVVVPLLGEDIPVLAWGPGFDRIILDYYKIVDIRDLYRNDVKYLRETKAWLRY